MADLADRKTQPNIRRLTPEAQGFLFTFDGDTDPLPGLEDFFSEVPIAEVPDLDFKRSRRRFTQGA